MRNKGLRERKRERKEMKYSGRPQNAEHMTTEKNEEIKEE
jgi:hypothetical protein